MTLTLTPELEAVLDRTVREGRFTSREEAAAAAITSLDPEAALPLEERERRAEIRSKSFFQLMQESPLRNIEIEFKRDRSPMRKIDL